jgi:hypothetical protein
MKKILTIFSFLFVFLSGAMSQNEPDANDRIRDKMREFIQNRMRLNDDEVEKFTPIFNRYYKEWRATLKDNREDRLILQQKIVELRLRYREEFKPVLGQKRSNEIYRHQEIFIQELRHLRRERINNGPSVRGRHR